MTRSNGRRPRKVEEERRTKFVEMWNRGVPTDVIATELGYGTPETVRARAKILRTKGYLLRVRAGNDRKPVSPKRRHETSPVYGGAWEGQQVTLFGPNNEVIGTMDPGTREKRYNRPMPVRRVQHESGSEPPPPRPRPADVPSRPRTVARDFSSHGDESRGPTDPRSDV